MREIAGAALRYQRGRQPLDRGLSGGQWLLDREQPRHHALDIAVDRHRRCIKGDRRNRRRGVVADAGQQTQRIDTLREYAAMALDDGARASM